VDTKDDTNPAHDVGESKGRRGEDVAKKAKEPGRADSGKTGKTDRPTGTSTQRDRTGVDPNDPINSDKGHA